MKTLNDLTRNRPLHVVRKGQSVQEVVDRMASNNVGAVPVLDGSRLIGIFSERDLMVRCNAKKIDLNSTRIEDVMTKKVILMESDDSYEDCLKIMKQQGIRHIPVRQGDKLIGMVSMRDLMQFDSEEKKEEIDVLQSYIHYFPEVAKEP
jgi:CBS domain-containing protein